MTTTSESTKDWLGFVWNQFLVVLAISCFFGAEYGLSWILHNVLSDILGGSTLTGFVFKAVQISLSVEILAVWLLHGTFAFWEVLRRMWNSFRG